MKSSTNPDGNNAQIFVKHTFFFDFSSSEPALLLSSEMYSLLLKPLPVIDAAVFLAGDSFFFLSLRPVSSLPLGLYDFISSAYRSLSLRAFSSHSCNSPRKYNQLITILIQNGMSRIVLTDLSFNSRHSSPAFLATSDVDRPG